MTALDGKRIGFIGGGKMAAALAGGLRAAGVAGDRLLVSDVDAERRALCERELGARTTDDNAAVARESDVVVIAVKPGDVDASLAGVDPGDAARALWISIAAGITLARLEARLGANARAVRAMPNTPALVQTGATAICGNAGVDAADLAVARALFDGVGETWVAPEEGLLDAVTGLSGSGPAYVFLFLEALQDAGERAGLPRDAAIELATQTVYGAARLARESEHSPVELRRQVSSPGGTTVEGIAVLEDAGLRDAVRDAVAAAARRSKELASS